MRVVFPRGDGDAGFEPGPRLGAAARVDQGLSGHEVHGDVVRVLFLQLGEGGDGIVDASLFSVLHTEAVEGERIGRGRCAVLFQKRQTLVHAGSKNSSRIRFSPKPGKLATTLGFMPPSTLLTTRSPKRTWRTWLPG